MYQPKISIVIPAYNAANYLAEAIDSALSQTYSNIEIIVVNDGSNDNGETERIALSYGDKIRYFSKENGGSSSALNMGIANMTGEWFSWLSHDDLYFPEKLEKQIEYMRALNIDEKQLSCHILFSAYDSIDANGKVIRRFDRKKENAISKKLDSIPNTGYLVAEPTENYFHGCSCLVHKDVFAKEGVFDEKLRLLNDYNLWFRIYTAGYKIHYIPEPLVKGRIHAKQVSRSIGYSYHNPEQDKFWTDSFNWIITNYPDDEQIFFLFGRNAYLKTRNVDGDKAFEHLFSIASSRKMKLFVLKHTYKCYAKMKFFIRDVYLKLKK